MIELMTTETEMELTQDEACFAYGMSKMTVRQDVFGGPGIYLKIQPVEFYEYVGRCAAAKFKTNFFMPLHKKIERALDIILPHFKLKRNEAIGEQTTTESDSDELSDDSVEYEEVD